MKIGKIQQVILVSIVRYVVPHSVLVISRFLILSRKPIGTALGSSCLKSGTSKTSLFVIFMISDQSTFTCLHHNTQFMHLSATF